MEEWKDGGMEGWREGGREGRGEGEGERKGEEGGARGSEGQGYFCEACAPLSTHPRFPKASNSVPLSVFFLPIFIPNKWSRSSLKMTSWELIKRGCDDTTKCTY